jgi:hypothetical protein
MRVEGPTLASWAETLGHWLEESEEDWREDVTVEVESETARLHFKDLLQLAGAGMVLRVFQGGRHVATLEGPPQVRRTLWIACTLVRCMQRIRDRRPDSGDGQPEEAS